MVYDLAAIHEQGKRDARLYEYFVPEHARPDFLTRLREELDSIRKEALCLTPTTPTSHADVGRP